RAITVHVKEHEAGHRLAVDELAFDELGGDGLAEIDELLPITRAPALPEVTMHGPLRDGILGFELDAVRSAAGDDLVEHLLGEGRDRLVTVARAVLREDKNREADPVPAYHRPLVLRISPTCCTPAS